MIVKLSFSGGKDSFASALLHLNRGDCVHICTYIPFLKDDIPLLLKSHYEYILSALSFLRSKGCFIHLTTGISYYDYVLKKSTRGSNKGKIYGFPCVFNGKCGFKRDSKLKSIEAIDFGYYDILSVGIAYDEFSRYPKNNEFYSILIDEKYTELDCFNLVRNVYRLSPQYDNFSRDGCALCYNSTELERNQYFSDFPSAIPIVLYLQSRVMSEVPNRAPLRNYEYFIDDRLLKFDGLLY